MKKYYFLGLFILSVGIGAAIYFLKPGASGLNSPEVDWRLLAELDYMSGESTPALKKFDQQVVKIPGFMVPLEDDLKMVTEFLLVPTPQACIHVPPPPPNQMVYIKMKQGIPAAQGPIWVQGKFHIATQRSQYGEVSFEVLGEVVEPYN